MRHAPVRVVRETVERSTLLARSRKVAITEWTEVVDTAGESYGEDQVIAYYARSGMQPSRALERCIYTRRE